MSFNNGLEYKDIGGFQNLADVYSNPELSSVELYQSRNEISKQSNKQAFSFPIIIIFVIAVFLFNEGGF